MLMMHALPKERVNGASIMGIDEVMLRGGIHIIDRSLLLNLWT